MNGSTLGTAKLRGKIEVVKERCEERGGSWDRVDEASRRRLGCVCVVDRAAGFLQRPAAFTSVLVLFQVADVHRWTPAACVVEARLGGDQQRLQVPRALCTACPQPYSVVDGIAVGNGDVPSSCLDLYFPSDLDT